MLIDYYITNKFVKYEDKKISKYYIKENIKEITIARLIASIELESLESNLSKSKSKEKLEILKLIEYNILNDIINNRFRFNDYINNKLNEEIESLVSNTDLLELNYSLNDYEKLYEWHKKQLNITHNDNIEYIKLTEEFIEDILDSKDNSALDNIANIILTNNSNTEIKFVDKIYNEDVIVNLNESGYIILDNFIKNDKFLFNEYISQICRSTYYLDLITDLFIRNNGYLKARVIKLGIDKDSFKNLSKLSSDEDILRSVYQDIFKYLSMFSLLISTRIVLYFNKVSSKRNMLKGKLSDYIDLSNDDNYSLENITDMLKNIENTNKVNDHIIYTLINMMNYNYKMYEEVVCSLMGQRFRNCSLLNLEVTENIDKFIDNNIKLYIDGERKLYVNSYTTIEDIKKIIVDNYIKNKYTSIIFRQSKNEINSLKNILTNSSIESLIELFTNDSKIFNKIMCSLIESGRSASIAQYNNELYKEPINGIASYININNTPYGKMIFIGKFDNTDRLRELSVNLIDNNDIELNYFIEILSDSISLILQSCYDYKESFNKICKLLKKFNNINLIQFTYKSNMIFEKEYNIYNMCDLLYYVLQELEYLYMLNKYGDPNIAISNMKTKFLLEESNNE